MCDENAGANGNALQNNIWNIGTWFFATLLVGVGVYLSSPLIHAGVDVRGALQIIAAVIGIPTLLVLACFGRVSREQIGVIVGLVIGFAFTASGHVP